MFELIQSIRDVIFRLVGFSKAQDEIFILYHGLAFSRAIDSATKTDTAVRFRVNALRIDSQMSFRICTTLEARVAARLSRQTKKLLPVDAMDESALNWYRGIRSWFKLGISTSGKLSELHNSGIDG